MRVATIVADACSDMTHGFELWNGTQSVLCDAEVALPAARDLEAAIRLAILDSLTALRGSTWPVAASPRLAQTIEEWSHYTGHDAHADMQQSR